MAIFFLPDPETGVVVCAATYFVRMFLLSAAYHRYFAHRSYNTSRPVQFLLGLFGLLTMQNGPLWWAATHRNHHRHADTPDDLHSPRYHGFLYAHSLWFLDRKNRATDLSAVPDLAKYPELRWLNSRVSTNLAVAAYAAGLYALFGWTGFVWGFCVSTVLLLHTTHWIQSISHSAGGYRRFATPDESRNHWVLGVVSLGEWHNNHHHSPGSARQGWAWWEPDVTWAVLRVLSWFRLVWDVREFPADQLHRATAGDAPAARSGG
ncbi:acyl-CoA desaturase [Gemmata sp. G18]|uniref:Acyl-CoA desaturase n=1 Tax=Gemmata palustris TaxID=2822762 RepID=A0ABS5BYB3_9BACT|nr:acyl-CoA desaturase [Gemmata palustris]MBP3957868.1 acyl-CoA desaturase [Gemmata palustris]